MGKETLWRIRLAEMVKPSHIRKMRIQYASDLHLEFPLNSSYLERMSLEVNGDILVLAGDIAYLGHPMLKKHPFFDWCANNYRQTLIVPGNHEYYNCYPLENTEKCWQKDIRDNVCYINNKSFRIDDTEIFCTTLWTRVDQLQEKTVQRGMADFSLIRYNGRPLIATDYARLCDASIEWLDKALRASDARLKIVVSHHCPTRRTEFNNFPESSLNSAFMVDLDSFIESHPEIDYWVYGHTHFNGGPFTQAGRIGNTQLLCNQLGYIEHHEGEGFRRDAVIAF